MREVSDALADVITAGGAQVSYQADVIVDGETAFEALQLAPAQLDWDADRQVLGQGSCSIVYADENGRSIVPETIADAFTPYATTLSMSMRVTSGSGFDELVPMGVFRIEGVSDPRERYTTVNGQRLAIASSMRLRLADEFARVVEEDFPLPQAPSQTSSAWAELQALTGLGVLRVVDDVEIPRDLAYDTSRIGAVFSIGRLLGGRPYVTPSGLLSLLPDEWPDEGPPLTLGADDYVVPADPAEWSAAGVFNEVVVLSFDTSQNTVLGRARITTGPLRFGGPFGRRTKVLRDEQVTTEMQGQELAESALPRYSTRPARRFSTQLFPDPRREVGDVVSFTRENEVTLTGRIVQLTLAAPGAMTVVVEVPSA